MSIMNPSRSEGKNSPPGFVSLVGAGPGNPNLITLLGLERLRCCEVLIHDRLIPLSLLEEVPDSCAVIDVGKNPGSTSFSQSEINDLLVQKGSEGNRVVRLKGGDPGIFGRVGEEANALTAAGIPFEIVPGVTAASAAAAAAGIPLTGRGLASVVALATAHEDPAKEESGLDWGLLAGAGTTVFYMPGGMVTEVAQKFLKEGVSPDTPAVAVQMASLPSEKILEGTLKTFAHGENIPEKGTPFVLIVGEVCATRDQTSKSRPLAGRTIVLTHPIQSCDSLQDSLLRSGARIIHCPSIEILPPENPKLLEEAIERLSNYNWVLFTSKSAVESVIKIFRNKTWDARRFGGCQVAAVGEGTARRLGDLGINPDLIADDSSSEGLAAALLAGCDVTGQHFLFPASSIARSEMVEAIESGGGKVDRVTAYRTETFSGEWSEESNRALGTADGICFASSSAARGFHERLGGGLFKQVTTNAKCFSMGPRTTETLRELGVSDVHEAEGRSLEGLLSLILTVCPG